MDLPASRDLVDVDGIEYLALASRLGDRRDAPVALVSGYSLDEALAPYRSIGVAWAALVALGLLVELVGVLLIARGVSSPIEILAARARRIAAGDYASPAEVPHAGEIGDLAAAFTTMAQAIGEREDTSATRPGTMR